MKTDSVKKNDPATAQNAFNQLQTTGDAPVTFEEAFDIMDATDDKMLVELSGDVFKFDTVGQTVSFIFLGMQTKDIKGENKEVATLQTRDGKKWINWDAVLVSACSKLQSIPCWIKVTYVKDTPGKLGTYKELSIKTYPVS